MFSVSVVQTVLDHSVQQTLSQIRPSATGGSWRVPPVIPNIDHLDTYRFVEQNCKEWGVKMWLATIDFMKAFDSISHNSIWKALGKCGIEKHYISLLKRLYTDQKAKVLTDQEESDFFEIFAGRPAFLFALLLCSSSGFENDPTRWQKKKGMGICFGDNESDCLTNLRFADDVLLFATSLEQLRTMMCEFKQSTEKKSNENSENRKEYVGERKSKKKRETRTE